MIALRDAPASARTGRVSAVTGRAYDAERDQGMHAPAGRTRLRLQLLAALPLPLLVGLWALWRDVYVLDASGIERVGGGRGLAAWALLSLASAALVACLFAPIRPLRVTGYTFHTLSLSIAFGVAAVLGRGARIRRSLGRPRARRPGRSPGSPSRRSRARARSSPRRRSS